MGKGSKSRREMNRLIKVIKRNRNLKQTARKSYPRPALTPDGQPFGPADEATPQAAPMAQAVSKPETAPVEETQAAE